MSGNVNGRRWQTAGSLETGPVVGQEDESTERQPMLHAPARATRPPAHQIHSKHIRGDNERDGLAEAGFVALAPDLYHGKTTAAIEEAEVLGRALDGELERVRGDIRGAMRFLRLHDATNLAEGRGELAFIGFSLGGAYALDMSVNLPEEIAAVVTFYATYPDLDYSSARAAYLCHFAENDPYEPAESVAEMEKALQAGGKPFTFYTYQGTTHWFFEANRPDAFDAAAAALAWERTISFIQTQP